MNIGGSKNIADRASGFTVIELLVVIAVIGTLLGVFAINLNSGRANRNLKIAQSNLVTDLRKIQSYTLSSRTIYGLGQPAQYYIMQLNLASSTQYTMQAMYNVTSSPQLQDIETIKFPQGVSFSSTNPIKINGTPITTQCALVAFKLPYG